MAKKRKTAEKQPEDFFCLSRLGVCGKCGAPLPVTVKTQAGIRLWTRRHLCLDCEPDVASKS